MQGIRYFIRDDDVGELTDALRFFVQTFAERRLPVSYQIIPAQLTPQCADYLLETEAANPGLIEFGQHGLTHHMELGGERLNREFGPERDLTEQQAIIDEGLALLKAHLGADRRISVFTPPQHKYDANTIKAVARAGYTVFSAAYYPTTHHQLIYALGRRLGLSSLRQHGISYNGRSRPEAAVNEVSIAVDVDDGKAIRYGADAIPGIVDRARRYTDAVGFMFHHFRYDAPAERRVLTSLADRLADYGVSNFRQLSSLGGASA